MRARRRLGQGSETCGGERFVGQGGARLREVLNPHWNAFRRDLRGESRARIKPLTMTVRPEAKLVMIGEGVESPNFKESRWVSIAVEALLQRGPGAPEPPDEAVERLVSRGPDIYMEPEQRSASTP